MVRSFLGDPKLTRPPTTLSGISSWIAEVKPKWMSRPKWTKIHRPTRRLQLKTVFRAESFTRPIVFEASGADTVMADTRGFATKMGVAMIDTGCEVNLVSRDFASNFYANLDAENATAAFEFLDQPYKCIKKITANWYCLENPEDSGPAITFDPSMKTSEFYVMEGKSRFDVIIGKHDLRKFACLDLELVAPFFRSIPRPVDGK
jgi:hypothetical protein